MELFYYLGYGDGYMISTYVETHIPKEEKNNFIVW